MIVKILFGVSLCALTEEVMIPWVPPLPFVLTLLHCSTPLCVYMHSVYCTVYSAYHFCMWTEMFVSLCRDTLTEDYAQSKCIVKFSCLILQSNVIVFIVNKSRKNNSKNT